MDIDYNVRMGYWASRNNVQEYKVYATMIWMFDPIFMNNLQQAFDNNSWRTKPTNHNYKTHLSHQVEYPFGTDKVEQYSMVEASCKNGMKMEMIHMMTSINYLFKNTMLTKIKW